MRDGIWRANLFLHGKLDVAQIPEMHNFLQKNTEFAPHSIYTNNFNNKQRLPDYCP